MSKDIYGVFRAIANHIVHRLIWEKIFDAVIVGGGHNGLVCSITGWA